MVRVAVDLHTHERQGSYDSRTSAASMWRAFASSVPEETIAVGYVGHDYLVGVDAPGVTFDGIEHTVSRSRPEIHVVEYPDHDFSFLAHPRRVSRSSPRQAAIKLIRELDLDGVEKWNNGVRQYEGTIDGVVELANSDAHNVYGYPSSHMVVDVQQVAQDTILRAIRAGKFDVVTAPTTRTAHKADKAFSMLPLT